MDSLGRCRRLASLTVFLVHFYLLEGFMREFIILGLVLSSSLFFYSIVVAEDWSLPSLTSDYVDVLSDLKERDESSAKMDFSSSTNIPSGAIRLNRTVSPERFEEWNGSSWAPLQASLHSHLNSNGNPHAVTASQVGAASSSTLSAHTGNSSNPHNLSASQVGALARSSNLSDVTNTATARSNLSVPSLSTFNSHANNTNNPHSVDINDVGGLIKVLNLADVPDKAAARNNLQCLASGTTQFFNTVQAPNGSLNLISSQGQPLSNVIVKPGPFSSGTQWVFQFDGKLKWPNQPDYQLFSYTPTRSVNPPATTPQINANVLNTLISDLIDAGVLK